MSDRLDTPVPLREALAWPAGDGRPMERSNSPPANRSWFREGIDRMVVPPLTASRILNDRVNQFHATAALRAVLHRTRCGRAATVRASLHRGARPVFGAAPPAMPGSLRTTGGMPATQAGRSRGPDGSHQAGAATEARGRAPPR